jgi:hypothetical protein
MERFIWEIVGEGHEYAGEIMFNGAPGISEYAPFAFDEAEKKLLGCKL